MITITTLDGTVINVTTTEQASELNTQMYWAIHDSINYISAPDLMTDEEIEQCGADMIRLEDAFPDMRFGY